MIAIFIIISLFIYLFYNIQIKNLNISKIKKLIK